MCKLAAKLGELHNQLATNDKYKKMAEMYLKMLTKQQLWVNITREAVEELPYAQWLEG